MKLQLSHDPLTVEVSQPPSLLLVEGPLSGRVRLHERDPEEPLLVLGNRLGQRGETALPDRRGGWVGVHCSRERTESGNCISDIHTYNTEMTMVALQKQP